MWSFAETRDEVAARVSHDPVVVNPKLNPDSVFDLLAGLSGGGLTVSSNTQTRPAASTGLVIYTSGTTGSPKGVRLSIDNLEAAAHGSVVHLGHGPDDSWLLAMPLYHVGGLSILVRQVVSGGSVRLLDRFDPARVAATMTGPVSMVSVVPTMLRRLLVEDVEFSGLRAVLVGGGPSPAGLLEAAMEVGLPVLPTYGMTETFGQVATLRPGSPIARKAHPLPGVELRIGDGERISVAGPQVSPGYVGEPDRTSEWFVTSDRGMVDPDGALRVLGRVDDVIISGGRKVDPSQVEAEILAHPQVDDAVVVGLVDPDWGERVAAVIQGEATWSRLAAWLGDRLESHLVPKQWLRVDQVPRNAMGKPDRERARRLLCGDA